MFSGKPLRFKIGVLILLTALGMLAGVFLGGCGQRKPSPASGGASGGRIQVVATIYPLADFARLVGGERVSVTQLLPQEAEPHDWEPSPKDIMKLYRAKLVIYNGAGLEPWMARLLPSLQSKGVRAMEATKGLQLLTFAEEEKQGWTTYVNGSGRFREKGEMNDAPVDPHAWLDPLLAREIVSRMAKELIAVDPAGKVDYMRRAQALQNRLADLDRAYTVAARGFRRKDIIVSHAAFGYLGRRYGLRQVPLLGLVPEQEPDAATLAKIVDYGRKQGIRYVFTEPTVNPRVAETVARELGVSVLPLTPIDSLSQQERERRSDYFDLMLQNLNNLKKALGE